MKPDEEFVYNTATHEARAEKSYVEIYTAWKNGQVVLKNTSLAETLKILSKRFNVFHRCVQQAVFAVDP